MVQKKWQVIPAEQRESVKTFALNQVMSVGVRSFYELQYSATMESVQQNEELLHKWDIILVEIFKKEWPNSWSSFIHDLVVAATVSESRCINNIYILKIVIEDVFQFGSSEFTSKFNSQIREGLRKDIAEVYGVSVFLRCM